MLTGRQVRAARKLVQLTLANLSRDSGLAQNLLQAIESTDGEAWLTPEQETALRETLERSGIAFTSAGGVRLQKVET